MNLDFLKELIDTPSVSGNEFELQKKLLNICNLNATK